MQLVESGPDYSGLAKYCCSGVSFSDFGVDAVNFVVELNLVSVCLGLVTDVLDDFVPVAVFEMPEPLEFGGFPHPFVGVTGVVGDGLEQ